MIEYLQNYGGYNLNGLTMQEKKELEHLRVELKKYREIEEQENKEVMASEGSESESESSGKSNSNSNSKARVYTKSTPIGRSLAGNDETAYARVLILPAILVFIFIFFLVSYMIFMG